MSSVADPGVPGADGVFDPGMDPVGGVNAGVLPPPAFGCLRQVGHLQLAAVAVLAVEQGQLCGGVGRSRRAKIRIVEGQPASLAASCRGLAG
jgi:hypothetical protein